ncbi:MAG: N-acetylmuramoyl-L-alanine amidase [Defluviitaleaceae bacterium]|nr:N-acetylmuramoyl-L-alanine amidase [Defluviitaleaceae bacterium]
MRKVYIHPGHGGHDPGAVGNGMRESDINLEVALHVEKILQQASVDVRLSRRTDVNVGTSEIVQAVNEWGADCFIDIHCNSFHLPSANGYETFFPANKPGDRLFAKQIHEEFLKNFDIRDRGIKPDGQTQHSGGIARLRQVRCPACLPELAFISASASQFEDVPMLRDRRYEMAQALAQGILLFLSDVEKPDMPECGAMENAKETCATDTERIALVNARFNIDGVEHEFPAINRDGRIFTQARDLLEALGYKVDWDADTRTVLVTSATSKNS